MDKIKHWKRLNLNVYTLFSYEFNVFINSLQTWLNSCSTSWTPRARVWAKSGFNEECFANK